MESPSVLELLVELWSVLSCLRCVESFLGSQPSQNHLQSAASGACGAGPAGYYNGSVSVTEAGAPCLSWAEFPDYVQQYPARGLGAHNHCRNPDGGTTPWCFFRLPSGAIAWANCDCRHGAVRLAEDRSVELYFNGLWGTVCADHWTDWDASVVCRQLGLSEIGTGGKKSQPGLWPVPLHLQAANCHGDEEALLQCGYQEAGAGACTQGVAVVACVPPEGVGAPLRLAGGKESFEGRVEVYHDGKWGTICDDQWDDRDAEVVCRQLGLSGNPKALSWAHYGQGSGPILLDEVECSGNELSLDQCKKSDWGQQNCDHIEDAGVSCDPFTEGTVRLAGGQGPHEGRVEVYYSGDWGTVCDDGWTELAAQVVCRQLGFSGPATLASEGDYGAGQGFILLDDVACVGTELSLLDCPHSNWGQHDCSHTEDVGVRCSPEGNTLMDGSLGPPVRLVDGESTKEGRVEVFLNGQWGSVCDDDWTDRDAAVVCRQLGFSGTAKARAMAYFGEGHGPIHLEKTECSGTEHTLAQCARPGSGAPSCWHSEDAGVICDYVEEKVHDISRTGPESQVCGMRLLHRRKKRIIGGNKSLRGGWPWQASLRVRGFHPDTRLLCGATLVSSCWVVTAAHCFKRFGVDVRRYVLRVGDYHTGVRDDFERELPVERVVLHRNYWAGGNDNDIALVRARGRAGRCLAFNRHVLPVCLPGRRDRAHVDRQACVISGWGDTGKSYSRTLLQGVVPLLPREDCEARYGHKFTTRMICAGNLSEHKRVDSCQGDSGGPLVCQRPNGRWVILGITSWGYGCGRKDSPGVYTKVSKYVPWIKRVTKLK
ncbi:neurotrypsin-like isoform X1 [Colius striatus]|uniref:neurotrypsin-like isoform X1 n=1 Tax=Colius striatus TaxID=57412 RepID=UPI002B1D241A|nr:neurotrypsin-like isoform X1 [Colius striatus]XP_061856806.1 neurotrypsin-like isoform X1 [Colius striatus]XP_061856807.1 neurotrypsin-like isoform X1 [Colius striatus]XP_061856808.1 neurotrypsin-like isoform X1 [Colius striatus]XP_061856809.1 neurotrypsin-like isoform X1 [Colius striatus]XP_061856810.1 neurotrypsin-like isoform X1 [Colius striatus]XP_061856811.1 neurotrypsin-like isoform X1 [Colius striatus]XP_061856812.1 neurotrypsin-like isoform X1 [Colius striatus]